MIIGRAGNDAFGNPLWNGAPIKEFLIALAKANLAAATAAAEQSFAALRISWSSAAISVVQGVAIGVAAGGFTIVTGGFGAVVLAAGVPALLEGVDMYRHPQDYTPQEVVDWWAGATGATIGGAAWGGAPRANPAKTIRWANSRTGEVEGWNNALRKGHIGIRGPGDPFAPGADYITLDPSIFTIVVWDAKFRSPGVRAPSTLNAAKLQRWMPEVQEAIEAMPNGPAKTAAWQAYSAGRIKGEIFIWRPKR